VIYTEEKADALRQELFQPPPNLPHIALPDLTYNHPNDITWYPITKEELRKAIFNPRTTKAPGLSQINYQILRWAWKANQMIIHKVINSCTNTGYHPKIWCTAIAIALAKPGKPNYSDPRAYRLIQLLECIGKVLEKIMADRLTYYLNKYKIAPYTQFGARKGSSMNDVALILTHDIQNT
jgi:hypothetical protein